MPTPMPIACSSRSLPAHRLPAAAAYAIEVNPTNRPGGLVPQQRLALLTSKYWGPVAPSLLVSFLDNPTAACRRMILSHMNAWSYSCGFRFRETRGQTGHVRIARAEDGYWSYLGTDIMSIPDDQPTMNLQGFTEATPGAEYARVVRHETGHTMGFPHEHMRREIVDKLDPEKTIAYFMRNQGWSRQEVLDQVLTPLEDAALIMGPVEGTSIMTYQIPGEITRDGVAIPGGTDITPADYMLAGRVYPPLALG